MNYLPGVELGGRRMVGPAKEGDWWDSLKAAGAKERMDKPLRPGYTVRIPTYLHTRRSLLL